MKKTLSILLVITLVACKKESILPPENNTQITANKGSFSFRDSRKLDWTGSQILNPCTGELLTATFWNTTVTTQGIYNGSKSSINIHITGQLKMVSTSGIQYTGATNFVVKEVTFTDGTLTSRARIRETITSPSGGSLTFTKAGYLRVSPEGTITYVTEPITELVCHN